MVPPPEACRLALQAADAVGGALVGVDLLPVGVGGWTILEVNGAADFTGAYALTGDEIFSTVRAALLSRAAEELAYGAERASITV